MGSQSRHGTHSGCTVTTTIPNGERMPKRNFEGGKMPGATPFGKTMPEEGGHPMSLDSPGGDRSGATPFQARGWEAPDLSRLPWWGQERWSLFPEEVTFP